METYAKHIRGGDPLTSQWVAPSDVLGLLMSAEPNVETVALHV